jgi:DNA mismatch endonuclease (patch repair protein)
MRGEYRSWASSPAVRAVMLGNRRRDTSPEMAVRRLVHAAGLRYRVDTRPVPELNRRADLVFAGPKVAVFIDGCYWHGCPTHGTVARTNAGYWQSKIAKNRDRDAETTQVLLDAGWVVLRVWEHDDPADAAHRIVSAVREGRA